jgi:spore germination cell wall hydrolase CwlJ-like protein
MTDKTVHQPIADSTQWLVKALLLVTGIALSMMALTVATEAKMSSLRSSINQPGSFQQASMKERDRQLKCLAQNIYYEAGWEPFEGKVAVAQVTLNRARSGQFPEDICQVVFQKTHFEAKIVCQFSWYCDQPTRARPINQDAFNESYEVAKRVLLEGFRLESIKTALFYHADYVNPRWGKEQVAKIGRHIFYSDRKLQRDNRF